ncbi:MAG: hypothetical protein ABIQ75_05995 [Flavobacteriales bacterium]
MIFPRALLVWLVLMVLAILNGTVREYGITPLTGGRTGHWISTFMLCAFILLATWAGLNWMGPQNTHDAWRIGIFWTTLTIAFEFGAGHFLFKHPWSKLFAEYNLLNGRIWVLVLLTTLLAPWVVGVWRGLQR